MSDEDPSPPRSLLARVADIWDPVWLRTWAHGYRGKTTWTAFAVRQAEVFMLTLRSLHQEKITLRAAALTYHTLLSIVPLLAVAFALFKAFGGLSRLEGPLKQAIVDNLAVGRAGEVGRWLDQFIQNINAGAIAGVGVLILFYSAVGLLTNMERSLNEIWASTRRRPFFIRFAIYWCMITIMPPLVGYSISLTARFQSSSFATTVLAWLPFNMGKVLLSLTSLLSVCVAFMLIYLIVPSAKVRVQAAMLGGLVGGLLWNLSKYLFINLTAGSMKYSAIYGALGVLPLLMLWMYISWLIVLFGATYAFALQSVATERLEMGRLHLNQAFRERLALRLVVAAAARFRRGEPPPTLEQLATEVEVMAPVVHRVLDVLCQHKVLLQSGNGEEDRGYLPAQDLQDLTAAAVMRVLRQQDGQRFIMGEDPVSGRIDEVMAQADAPGEELLERVTLRSLTDPK